MFNINFQKFSATATAIMFLFTVGCGDDKPRRAKQPWASTPSAPAVDVTAHAAAGVSSDQFSLDLIYAKVAQGMQDPGELQTWISETPAVNTGVDVNPENGSLDAIMVSMETIGNSQCFLFGAVEESTFETPFNVGRVCISETETGEVAIQATYPEHVHGYQNHSYYRLYPRSHFGSGFLVGAALAAIMLSHRPGFRGGYWGGGRGGWGHRPVMSVSQRTTVRTTHITNNKVVAPKAKPRPANVKKSKAATRTASKFANKGGAIAGKPGDSKLGSRKGMGTKFKAGPGTKATANNNSFLSKGSQGKAGAAGGKSRATMPKSASVASRRAAGTMPKKGQPATSRPGSKAGSSKTRRPTSRPATRRPPRRPTTRPRSRGGSRRRGR